MRHRVDHRKLGRTSAHREALLRNLSIALFDREKITTTLAKAKELRRYAERLVTLSKRETLHARRLVLSRLQDRTLVAKLFDTLSARYAKRPGGYTRIIRLGPRRGDAAPLAVIELVDGEVAHAHPPAGKAKGAAGKAGKAEKSGNAGKADPEAAGAEKAKDTPKAKTKGGATKSAGPRSAADAEHTEGKKPSSRAKAGRTGPAKATRSGTASRKSGSGEKSD